MTEPKTQLRWGNIPIPYVALWSSELHQPFIQYCPFAQAPALCSGGKRGEGKPVFGKMHEARQREVVARKFCQVCRQRPNDGRLFCMEVPALLQNGMRSYPLFTEPPVCFACGEWSLSNCPGLLRQLSHSDFRIYEVFEFLPVQQWLKPAGDGGEIDAAIEKFGRPCVGYLKLALLRFRNAADDFSLGKAA